VSHKLATISFIKNEPSVYKKIDYK
jgi:hypothetical protein